MPVDQRHHETVPKAVHRAQARSTHPPSISVWTIKRSIPKGGERYRGKGDGIPVMPNAGSNIAHPEEHATSATVFYTPIVIQQSIAHFGSSAGASFKASTGRCCLASSSSPCLGWTGSKKGHSVTFSLLGTECDSDCAGRGIASRAVSAKHAERGVGSFLRQLIIPHALLALPSAALSVLSSIPRRFWTPSISHSVSFPPSDSLLQSSPASPPPRL